MHSSDKSKQRLTVIICTYNRHAMLAHCLDSLTRQSMPQSSFDILVVDNNSTDATRARVDEFMKLLSNLSYVFEPQQGLSRARNRALAETTTEWVAYLDDDAIARTNWVQNIHRIIDMDDFDAFGGVYLPWHHFRDRPVWFDDSWATNKHVQTYWGPLNENGYISGGNCAMRREVAISCGGFPVEAGMKGKKVAYAAETLLFEHMRKTGYRLGFVPELLIDHCVMPYKYSFLWQMKAAFAIGRDHITIRRPDIDRKQELRESYKQLLSSSYSSLDKIIRKAIGKNQEPWKLVFIKAMKEVARSAGVFVALLTAKD